MSSDLKQILDDFDYSTTIDSKVEAFGALQNYFHENSESNDHYHTNAHLFPLIIEHIASSLNNQNAKLNIVALQVIPEFMSCVAHLKDNQSISYFKQLILTSLDSMVDKLGDNKIKVSDLTLNALVSLTNCLFNMHSNGNSTHHASNLFGILEKEIKNSGFGHKVAKGRENSISWLSAVYRQQGFQLKPYLPLVIKLLEDSNDAVRAKSKELVTDLYINHPSKAVKVDIRKLLTSENIRNSIKDAIIANSSHVLNHEEPTQMASASSENLTEKPKPDAYEFGSIREFEHDLMSRLRCFEGKENEHNWAQRENSLVFWTLCLEEFRSQKLIFRSYLKELSDAVHNTINSLRTTLVVASCNLLKTITSVFQTDLDFVSESLLNAALKLVSQAKKITSQVGIESVQALLVHSSFHSRMFNLLCTASQDKNSTLRAEALGFINLMINKVEKSHETKLNFEKKECAEILEKALKPALSDASPAVRENGRIVASRYQALNPEKYERFIDTLDVSVKKNLARSPPKSTSKRKINAGTLKSMMKKAKENLKKQGLANIDDFVVEIMTSEKTPEKSPEPEQDGENKQLSSKEDVDENFVTLIESINKPDASEEMVYENEQEEERLVNLSQDFEEISVMEKEYESHKIEEVKYQDMLEKDTDPMIMDTEEQNLDDESYSRFENEEAQNPEKHQDGVLDETLPFGFAELSTVHYDSFLTKNVYDDVDLSEEHDSLTKDSSVYIDDEEHENILMKLREMPSEMEEFKSMVNDVLISPEIEDIQESSRSTDASILSMEQSLPEYLNELKSLNASAEVITELINWTRRTTTKITANEEHQIVDNNMDGKLKIESRTGIAESMGVYSDELFDILIDTVFKSSNCLHDNDLLLNAFVLMRELIIHHASNFEGKEEKVWNKFISFASSGNHNLAAMAYSTMLPAVHYLNTGNTVKGLFNILKKSPCDSDTQWLLNSKRQFNSMETLNDLALEDYQYNSENTAYRPGVNSICLEFLEKTVKKIQSKDFLDTLENILMKCAELLDSECVLVRKNAIFCMVTVIKKHGELSSNNKSFYWQGKVACHYQIMIQIYLNQPNPETKRDNLTSPIDNVQQDNHFGTAA